jgi:hypothetical protein
VVDAIRKNGTGGRTRTGKGRSPEDFESLTEYGKKHPKVLNIKEYKVEYHVVREMAKSPCTGLKIGIGDTQ